LVIATVIGAVVAVIGVILGGLTLYHEWDMNNPKLAIELNKNSDFYRTAPTLQIIARNTGQTNIKLEGASLLYRDTFSNYKNSHYVLNGRYISNPTPNHSFPYLLETGSSFSFSEYYNYIAYSLQQEGQSGKVTIKIVFRDATGKEYPSETFIFDMSEAKNPSNPVNNGIL